MADPNPPIYAKPISEAHRDKAARIAESMIDELHIVIKGDHGGRAVNVAEVATAIEALDRVSRGPVAR